MSTIQQFYPRYVTLTCYSIDSRHYRPGLALFICHFVLPFHFRLICFIFQPDSITATCLPRFSISSTMEHKRDADAAGLVWPRSTARTSQSTARSPDASSSGAPLNSSTLGGYSCYYHFGLFFFGTGQPLHPFGDVLSYNRKPAAASDSFSNFGTSSYLGSHLITKNAHIPLSSTKKYFHGHTLFSRPFALPSTISRFSRFPRPFNGFPRPNAHFFTAKSCFHGHILIPRPNRFFEAIWPNGLWPSVSRSNCPPGITPPHHGRFSERLVHEIYFKVFTYSNNTQELSVMEIPSTGYSRNRDPEHFFFAMTGDWDWSRHTADYWRHFFGVPMRHGRNPFTDCYPPDMEPATTQTPQPTIAVLATELQALLSSPSASGELLEHLTVEQRTTFTEVL